MNPIDLQSLLTDRGTVCPACGKVHRAGLSRVIIERGAMKRMPEIVSSYNAKRVFLLADPNTYAAAGEQVERVLSEAGIASTVYLLNSQKAEPDEHAVGSVVMHFDKTCDLLVGVGSGVINDIGKIVANLTGLPYVIFGTAPSMDGYASATSSVIRDGLKYSLPSVCPDTVVGDLDILCAAPMRMILAGLGDMLAKYVSLVEWQMAVIINGEYYCGQVADLVSEALEQCVANLDGLTRRDPEAVRAVMNGMVLSGIAANYAGVSRPVSGMEHYISHILDMRGVEFGTKTDLHGIQCGVGTLMSLEMYEELKQVTPDREKALAFVRDFDMEEWKRDLRHYLGGGAEAMIENEKKEGKYDPAKHAARLEIILSHWEELRGLMDSLPSAKELAAKLAAIGMPTTLQELGLTDEESAVAFRLSKNIRDKYVGTRLLWDLGLEK